MLLLVDGSILFGLIALVASVVVGLQAYKSYSSAQATLEAWREALYCGKCDRSFPQSAALIAKTA